MLGASHSKSTCFFHWSIRMDDGCAVHACASAQWIWVLWVEQKLCANLWLSRDFLKRLWFGCLVHVLSKRSGYFQYLRTSPQDLKHAHRLFPLHISGWRNPRCWSPMISASCPVCTCTENLSGISLYAANAISPGTLDIPSKCPCCHVLLRQNYQKENLQNPRITGRVRLEGTSEPSGPTSLLHWGHPRGHCMELHPDCSWIILGKSRTVLALIPFLKSTPNTEI